MTYAGPREGWSAVSTAEAGRSTPFPQGAAGSTALCFCAWHRCLRKPEALRRGCPSEVCTFPVRAAAGQKLRLRAQNPCAAGTSDSRASSPPASNRV